MSCVLGGVPGVDPTAAVSPWAQEALTAMSNGTPPMDAFNAYLGTLPSDEASAIQQAVFAEDPADEPQEEEPEAPRYVVHQADEAFEPQPPVDWIVQQLISQGSVNLVCGAPGSYKTWLVLALLVYAAAGLDWLGFATKPITALLIDEESGLSRVKRRLSQVMRGCGAPRGLPIHFTSVAGFNLAGGNDVGHVCTLVDEVKPGLIVIDSLAAIAPGLDENSVRDMQPIMLTLRRLAESRNCAIVVIHHTNKSGGYRGSTAISGALDLLLMVDAKKGSQTIDLYIEKARDVEESNFSATITFDEVSDTVTLEAATAKVRVAHYAKSEEYVIRHLTKHGQAQMKTIMDNADACSSNAARQAVYTLVAKKVVRRCDGGGPGETATYELVPANGEDALDSL